MRITGRVGFGFFCFVVIVTVFVFGAFWREGTTGGLRASVVSAAFTVIGVAAQFMRNKARPSVGSELRRIANEVQQSRLKFLEQALGDDVIRAGVEAAAPTRAEIGAGIDRMLLRWRLDGDPAIGGDQKQIAENYRRWVRDGGSGRVVVLGAPGAGKTVLLSSLVDDLIKAIPAGPVESGQRVPVYLTLPSRDLGPAVTAGSSRNVGTRFGEWLADRLYADYKVRPYTLAVELASSGQIIPVLDGLDEMDLVPEEESERLKRLGATLKDLEGLTLAPRPKAAAVVRALNDRKGLPVVLACRKLDYTAVTAAAHQGDKPVLLFAQHVLLQPLTPHAVVNYLRRMFSGPDGHGIDAAWQAVCDELGDSDVASEHPSDLAQILGNPWLLYLSVVVLGGSSESAPARSPAELLRWTPSEAPIRLIPSLINQLATEDRDAGGRGYHPAKVERWLANIAAYQHRRAQDDESVAETNVEVLSLWRIGGDRWPDVAARLIVGLLFVGITLAAELGERGSHLLRVGWELIASVTIGWLSCSGAVTPRRLDWRIVQRRSSMRRIGLRLVYGLSPGFLLWALVLPPGFPSGMAAGFAGGLVAAFGFRRETEIPVGAKPTRMVRDDLQYLCMLTTLGVVAGITVGWPVVDFKFGLGAGVVGGLALGFTFGFGQWLRYAIGVGSAALRTRQRSRLPLFPARFLDWCVQANLVRLAGSNVQFRHRELQDYLLVKDWLSRPSEGTPDTDGSDGTDEDSPPPSGQH